ncbi:MAG TPA: hypothetical protein VM370_02910 [Candidatus Thermoplasmatota archaeon]|nr:hypothetical protein [Candidatus Thermoplasmatota archaeon]
MQQTENLAPHIQEIARALPNKLTPDAIEDELRRYLDYGVPLAQAKRDIVRMHGGTLQTGVKKVAELVPEEKGFELKVKIVTVNPKQITVKGEPKTIYYGFLGDDSGKVPYTAWKDHHLQAGQSVHVRGAYAKKGFREGIEVNLGDFVVITPITDAIVVKNDGPSSGFAGGEGGAARVTTERKVRELREGMSGVVVTGRILDLRERTVSTANGQKTLVEGELADETGRVTFAAWEPDRLPPEFKANAVVRIRSAYVKAYRGIPNLNVNQYTTIDILPANVMPDAATLQEEKPFNLGELEAAGGGEGILVEGVLLEVKKGSGIIFRCTHLENERACNRVLQKNECRIHGKQKGTPDLRTKAVLDDGFGAATFFVGREATEKILGKTLAQAQEMARDAMTVDVVQDELVAKLTGRRVVVRGRATSDEFGLQILANDLAFAPERDVQAEAEKLLAALSEVGL